MNTKILILLACAYLAYSQDSTTVEPPVDEATDSTDDSVVTDDAVTDPAEATTQPPSTCVDNTTDCANKASMCQQAGYVAFMASLCPKTCGYCDGGSCTDAKTQCAAWAANGYCTNTFYTEATKKETCAKTCNLCDSTSGPTTPCLDADSRCPTWNSAQGYCSSTFYTAEQKKTTCPKTCNLCTASATTPCADSDDRCATWAKNNYCTNTFYTEATKKSTCGKTCNLC